jgi:preprotein translocase subunit SecF
MRMITLVPTDTNVDFVGRRLIAFAFSGLLILASIGSYAVQGLNLGIDFLGGILIEIRTPEAAADIGGLRAELGGLGLGEVALQEFGQPSDVLIRVQRQEGDERAQQAAVEKVKAALGSRVEYRRTEFVGPKVGGELRTAAMWAVLSAIVAILLYISAILTIAGYSINDTVVVYDRVREEFRRYKKKGLPELLNLAINRTLSRTLLTSLTTLLALVALYAFGGEVVRGFTVALIWGVVIGTYSSIFVAVPMLLYLQPRRGAASDEGAAPGKAAETAP